MHNANARRPSRPVVLAALVALLVPVMPVAARDATAPAPATAPEAAPRGVPAGTVTGDGLAVTVNSDGSVGAVSEGGRAIAMNGHNGGFSVRMAGNQPNLVKNPGFESAVSTSSDVGNWRFPSTGTYRPTRSSETDAAHAGSYVGRVAIGGTAPKTSPIAYQTIAVSTSTNYTITASFHVTGVGPNSTETTAPLTYKSDLAPAAVRIEQLSSSNAVLRTNWVYAYTGTAGWHHNATGIKTMSNATKVRLAIGVRSGYGTVLFDDISLNRLLAPSETPLPMTAQPVGNAVEVRGNVTGQPLAVVATVARKDEGIEISGFVRNNSTDAGNPVGSTDRALQLSYTLPINATGWQWGDTARVSRTISSTGSYYFENLLNSPTARYPWATVFDTTSGISIGSPLSTPRAYALRYDSKGLTITFDLGTSRSATLLNGRADFKIQLFRSDETYREGAAWGFRGAIAKYYAMNAASFARRPGILPKREGIPFYQPPLTGTNALTPANAAKLHLGLNVLTLNNLRQGDYVDFGEQGPAEDKSVLDIYSAAYTHHWGHFQNGCQTVSGVTTCDTYPEARAKLDAQRSMSCGATTSLEDENCRAQKASATAAWRSSAKDMNDRIRYDLSDNGRDFRLRQIPGLTLGTAPEWFDAVRQHQMQRAVDYVERAQGTEPEELDAIYVDSASGMRAVWGDVDDYDRSHWAALPQPATLTFSYHSGRVVLQSFFANYLQLRQASQWAAANGLFLVIDTNGKEQSPGGNLGTDMADWLLMENSLRDLDVPLPPEVTTDSYAILKRTLASQRPVTSVDPKLASSSLAFGPGAAGDTGTTPLTGDTVTARVNESLFYGIWPGPDKWNANSVNPPWYRNANYVALYQKYGKLLRRLAAAGWEPITLASSSNQRVFLERYGDIASNDLHVAIRNATTTSQTSTIIVKTPGGLGLGATTQELVRGTARTSYAATASQVSFQIVVPAGVTLIVKVARPAP